MLAPQSGLPFDPYIHAVDQLNAITSPGINASLDQMLFQQMLGRDSQATHEGLVEILIGVIQRQPQFTQSQHGCGSALPPFDQTIRCATARLVRSPMESSRLSGEHRWRQSSTAEAVPLDAAAVLRRH